MPPKQPADDGASANRLPRTHRFTSSSAAVTEQLAATLATYLTGGDLLALCGTLGAGKTCFARGLARGLNVDPREVASPTFTLINVYAGRIPLAHVDFYRLGDSDELDHIGLDDYLGADAVCVIEWFDRFVEAMPAEYLRVDLELDGDDGRVVHVSAFGARAEQLLHSWIDAASELEHE
ncbi:MAG: tRNA (adenosine(37)-N6)-threonylcarbamoyltransferase complex ATPase subunit type 1 TsaE [Deltaproteobacteria bacterium]|nr:tRNA (adenosine(37)-N6)-threonylcarbamoyltransferase complex ATPase subunit type 1 TsaE [Deltaproteobacteria bacterium]